jgi:hypothetical protein
MPERQDTDSRLNSIYNSIVCSAGTAEDRRNQYRFVAWCLAWAVLFTGGNQLLRAGYALATPLTWLITAVPIVVGIGAVLAYRRYLPMTDEMMQKVQLEGLAVGFGIGVVFTLSYQVLERAGAPHLEIDDAAMLLVFGWMFGQFLAHRRYR